MPLTRDLINFSAVASGIGGCKAELFHVVFVALTPGTNNKSVVGVYAGARAEIDNRYTCRANTCAVGRGAVRGTVGFLIHTC